MTSRAGTSQPDPWTQYFAAATADLRSEKRRIHAAALAALLAHGLFFALRFPEGPLPVPQPEPLQPTTRLVDLVFRPRIVEPPPKPVEPQPTVVEPTMVVPGPPEVDIVLRTEPIAVEFDPVVPQIEPLDVLPLAPPPLPESAPVRYDASIEKPVKVFAPLPAYTPAARRIKRQGRLVLEAVIDTDGAVVDARIIKGLGFGLDESALETVATWRFEPARRRGHAIAVIYNLVINFRLH